MDPIVFVLLAVVFGLFVLFGRTKGAIAFFDLLIGLRLSGVWEQHHREAARRTATVAIAQQCFDAGQSRVFSRFAKPPSRIVVAADPALDPGSDSNPLRVSMSKLSGESGVEFVQALPTIREPDIGYVDIRILKQPVQDAENWFINGLRVTVTDASGQVLGERTDFVRGQRWCLGEEPLDATERFLHGVLGRPVGVAGSGKRALSVPAVLSPQGRSASLENGRFHYRQLPKSLSVSEDDQKLAATLIQPNAACSYVRTAFDQRVTCQRGTPQENSFELNTGSVNFESEGTWWLISGVDGDADYFFSLDIEERTPKGSLLRRWHVRFPPTSIGRDSGCCAVRNVNMLGRVLTAEVLSGRQIAVSVNKEGTNVTSEWYTRKVSLTAVLTSEANRLETR